MDGLAIKFNEIDSLARISLPPYNTCVCGAKQCSLGRRFVNLLGVSQKWSQYSFDPTFCAVKVDESAWCMAGFL